MEDNKKIVEEAVENIGKVVADVAELKKSKETIEQLTKDLNEQKEKSVADIKVVKDEFQKQLDKLIADTKKRQTEDTRSKSIKDIISQTIEDNKETLSKLSKGEIKETNIQVKDITAASFALPSTAYNPAFPASIAGIMTPPSQKHMRDLLPTGQISGNGIYYIQENSYSPKAGYQEGEGKSKTQVEVDFTTKFAPVVTIAAILKVSRQTFDDSPYISSYINTYAPQKLMEFEDNEILYGDGNTNHLEGLFTAATTVTADGTDDNGWDRIITALAQLSKQKVSADTVLLNEADALNLLKLKDDKGAYIFDGYTRQGAPLTIAGKLVSTLPYLNENDFLVANLAAAAQLLFREGINIRIFEQNEDDVVKNMLTIRVEERVALPIYRPNLLISGGLDGSAPTT